MLTHHFAQSLLAAQREIWLAQKVDPHNSIYNLGQYIEIHGVIDPALFEAALREILVEAEALRIQISEGVNEPQLVINNGYSEWSMPFIDFSEELDPKAAAEKWMKVDLTQAVDLIRDPLFNFVLFKVSPERFLWYQRYHHLAIDGLGGWLIARRVAEIYTSKANNQPDSGRAFAPLRLLIEDEKKYRKSQRFARDRKYWLECMAEMPEPVSLSNQPPLESSDFLRRTVSIQPEDAEILQMIAHHAGGTLPNFITAMVAAYLNRLTGANEIILGLSVTARLGAVSRSIPCMLSNVVPLRLMVHPGMTISELIKEAGQRIQQVLRHQRYRSEDLKRELSLTATNRKLFGPTVNFMLFDYDLHFAGHRATTHNLSNGAVEDLKIVVYNNSKNCGMRIDFDANPNLYPIDDLLSHQQRFLRLLEALSSNPDVQIGRIDLLSQQERRAILEEWNETTRELPQATLVELFEAQVRRTPGATAAVFEAEELSYSELNERANRLAHLLISRGIGPEDVVALALPRSLEMIVALLGVLKSGAAYLPIDPDYPTERIAFILQDAEPVVLLTAGTLPNPLPQRFELFSFGELVFEAMLDQAPPDNPTQLERVSSLLPQHAAYIIYTSGSTGRPKGVIVSHHGLINYICWASHAYQVDCGTGAPLNTPLVFDAAITSLYLPLIAGRRLDLLAEERQIEDLAELLSSGSEMTLVKLTPAHLEVLRGILGSKAASTKARRFVVGGEALKESAVGFWRDRVSELRIVNEYGPTETVVGCCSYEIQVEPGGDVPIGKPIWNTRVYVMDGSLKAAPVGVTGELYIAGAGLARGYLRRPALTAERFVADPYGEPGMRMYRTGDLARWSADGNLEFLGRADQQVKIRGFRIELGEIEAALRESPEVAQAAVVAQEEKAGDKRLLGYVVPASGNSIDSSALRQRLGKRLPGYMVPAVIVELETLPLTPNGKLDRQALQAAAPEAYVKRRYEKPEGETETELARIWTDLFALESVGRHDNFFELGGHSLLAVQVLSRLQQTLGVDVPLGELFAHPVLSDFALVVERSAQPALPAISPVDRYLPIELSFAQQRLRFIAQFEGASRAYHIACGLRLRGDLNRQAMRRALEQIIVRHEVLRTTFSQVDGRTVQVIGSAENRFRCEEEDLRGRTDAAGELSQIIERETTKPFDLERGPLIRGRLVRMDEDDHALLVTMHHIVSDGWSMRILFNELSALYQAYRDDEEAQLPDLPVQYADFAVWQRSWLQGEALERQLAYWRRQLGGELPVLELPTDKPRPAMQTYRGAEHSQIIPATLSDSLTALSLKQSCTLFMTLLAAFKTLLYYLTGQTDICVGTDIANRNRAEIENLIGFFVNQMVLRTELSPDSTFEELLAKVREITLGAYANQDLPFEKLVEAINPKREANRAPLFQVKMVLQSDSLEELKIPGLKCSLMVPRTVTAKFDLLLNLTETEHGLIAALEYNTDLFEKRTSIRLLDRYQSLLDRIVERPDARLQELAASLIEEDRGEQLEKDRELESIRLKKLGSIRRKVISETYAETEQ
jgi:glyine---[glycyl-carrier protein] ligase